MKAYQQPTERTQGEEANLALETLERQFKSSVQVIRDEIGESYSLSQSIDKIGLGLSHLGDCIKRYGDTSEL